MYTTVIIGTCTHKLCVCFFALNTFPLATNIDYITAVS